MGNKYHKKGFVVGIVLVAMILLIATGVALLNVGFKSRQLSARICSDICAKAAVDSAVAKALSHINQELADGIFSDYALPEANDVPLEYCDATFSYDIIKNDNGKYVIRATGFSGPVRKTAGAVLESQGGGASPFEHGILTSGEFQSNSGSMMYGYNPDDPTAPPGTYPISVGSATTAYHNISMDADVYGDVFCGVGGDTDSVIVGSGTITGNEYALTEEPEILQPVMPDDITYYGTFRSVSGTGTFTPSDSGVYSQINLNAGSILYIDGGTVTLGIESLLVFKANSQLIVKEGSTLLLYCDGDISCGSGVDIKYDVAVPDSTHIQFYGTKTSGAQIWSVKAKDTFAGVIYAPNAGVSVTSGGQMIGAVVSETFFIDSGDYLYDISLRDSTNIALDTGGGGTPESFTIARWSE